MALNTTQPCRQASSHAGRYEEVARAHPQGLIRCIRAKCSTLADGSRSTILGNRRYIGM